MSIQVGKIINDVIKAVGGIFKHTITAAEKDFNSLTPEQKDSLKDASGVLKFISQEIDETPQNLRAGILRAFPNLNEATLESGLYTIAHAYNLAPNQNSVDDTIAKLQAHFKGLHGVVWNEIVQTAATIFAFVIAPAGQKLEAGGLVMKYVYETFFNKK